MRTVKLVVIGPSGVGKTSLRSQYISGRFSTGYRATIGTDFITKTLPHHNNPNESITLQIWDTAGQERFSSLSTAFFRGADAVLLVFDVNKPETLAGLKTWWEAFRERAPVPEELAHEFACVVVGNKTDLAESLDVTPAVTPQQALRFLHDLIPLPTTTPTSLTFPTPSLPNGHLTRGLTIVETPESDADSDVIRVEGSSPIESYGHPSDSIDIQHPARHSRGSRATSRSRYSGTMTTTVSVYHTAASSLFESPPTPAPLPVLEFPNLSPSTSIIPGTPTRRRVPSSASSAPTITPQLLGLVPPRPASPPPPSDIGLDIGPKLFYTSAKTGQNVSDIFEYIARRVVVRWEWEEHREARRLNMTDSDHETIRIGQSRFNKAPPRKPTTSANICCSI